MAIVILILAVMSHKRSVLMSICPFIVISLIDAVDPADPHDIDMDEELKCLGDMCMKWYVYYIVRHKNNASCFFKAQCFLCLIGGPNLT